MDLGLFFFEICSGGESIVSPAVVVGSFRVVLYFDVSDVSEGIDAQEFIELGVASLLHELKLLLSPHVEAERTYHADVDTKAAVHSRAVDADEDGVADGRPGGRQLPTVETSVVLVLQLHTLEYSQSTLIFHLLFLLSKFFPMCTCTIY